MDHAVVVPIVFERRIVLETARMLNKSFIAIDDFPNVKALADYMKYLDSNETAYMEYFDWRNEYTKSFLTRRIDLAASYVVWYGRRNNESTSVSTSGGTMNPSVMDIRSDLLLFPSQFGTFFVCCCISL